jgi:two-component system response regulator YesN
MWRAILVDDEEYERAELAILFPWNRYQFDLIGEAENVQTAMALITETQPELVITDIGMSETDGLKLISWLNRNYPQMVVAVVSAYNDFSYVREALRLGAVDYLIKAEATLETTGSFLERIRGILDLRQSVRRRQEELAGNLAHYHQLATESFWRELLTGVGDEADIMLRSRRLGIVLEPVWFGLIFLHVSEIQGVDRTTFWGAFEAKIRADWDWNWEWDLIDCNRGDFLVLAHQTGDVSEPDALEKLQAIARRLEQDTTEKMTVGVLGQLCSFRDLPVQFRNVRELNARYIQPAIANSLSPAALTVRKALVYIQLNFTRELSLEKVAGHVGISKSYLSRVFSEYTGERFSAYLQRLRLERAKELLRFSNDRIYEIASQVGFWNSRYFSKVFQEAVGLTPADYRRVYRV